MRTKPVFGHRTRLTLAAAGSAGLLFFALFALAVAALRLFEVRSAQSLLMPVLSQLSDELKRRPATSEFAEAIEYDPDISLAIYDSRGKLIDAEGDFDLPLVPRPGFTVADGSRVLTDMRRVKDSTVVVGMSWEPQAALIRKVTWLLAGLWIPLVGVVAFATSQAAKATFFPLERLAEEAEALSLDRLEARMAVPPPGEYRGFVLRLNRFLDRLEASVRREEQFIADAAHELRTPLTVLRGQIETALNRSRDAEEYQATLKVVLEEVLRVSQLVELLLQSAVPAKEGVQTELDSAAESAHARWADRFLATGVTLQLNTMPASAHISSPEAEVILDNLLANALRASPPGSTCSIRVACCDSQAALSVADQGRGISTESSSTVFHRFARGNELQGTGFGIGLDLCKRIVEAHSGSIQLLDNQPHGSIFEVRLPLSPVH